MDPPKPVERIASVVVSGVRPEPAPVRTHLPERLLVPDEEYVRPRAERIATEALTGRWQAEPAELCPRGLADARELAQAQRCLDAARDLDERGEESWIAGAVLHRLAFDVSWDVLAEGCLDASEGGCPSPASE
jgi:hypothetical protein